MWFNFILLSLFTFSPWLLFSFLPKGKQHSFKLILSFSGAYLFSLTLLHILPEIYSNAGGNTLLVGIFILVGFFLQIILSYFAEGIEHGHLHHVHSHTHALPFTLLISISLHAFLEGNMLVHPFHQHDVEDNHSLMIGMILHKIPEAFALLSILYGYKASKWFCFSMFSLYALLSPLGMLFGTFAYVNEWVSPTVLVYVFALIAGNFMHISTTIFFESSPRHELKGLDTFAKLLGAVCAITFELIV
jgi:zinc transporter ZupT